MDGARFDRLTRRLADGLNRRRLFGLAAAFAALTPGRRRAYLLHFGGARQSATRARRIAACVPAILAGKGLQD